MRKNSGKITEKITQNMDIYIHMDSDKELRMDIHMDSNMEIRMDMHKGCCINYRGMGDDDDNRDNHVACDNCQQHCLHICNCSCLLRHLIQRIRSMFRIDGYQVADSFGNHFDNSSIFYRDIIIYP